VLKVLLGSKDKELVLQYLLSKNEGYATKIARFFDLNPSQIKKQLNALEDGDVLVGFQIGKARLYKFNPRYYFLQELIQLLKKAKDAYPDDMKDKLSFNRTAPRKHDKPYILKGDDFETEL
jgi:predicted ArsR family transcriptional regulator